MPDFFLDRLINLELDVSKISQSLLVEVAKRKGGSIDGIPQTDLRGGNAINVASALASLGVNVTPIVCTSEFGLQQIKYSFKNTSIDTSHVKTYGKASITTALEFKKKTKKPTLCSAIWAHLRILDPQTSMKAILGLIEDSDYACLFNWAGTLKFGTELAQTVFGRAKQNGKGKTYYDTADPTPNSKAIPDLMDKVLKTDKVDILSLNENEAITYASLLDEGIKEKRAV